MSFNASGLARDMSSSRNYTSRESARNLINFDAVVLMLNDFLDEWHYLLADAEIAMRWDRSNALILAIDVLAQNGLLVIPYETDKESWARLEDEVLARSLVELVPVECYEVFDDVAKKLIESLRVACNLRVALDFKENVGESLNQVVEETNKDSACHIALKNSLLLAADEIKKVKHVHATWRKATEDRIERLAHATQVAEDARNLQMKTEAAIEVLTNTQKGESRKMLIGLADKTDAMHLQTAFCAWSIAIIQAKEEIELRNKFQKQLEDAMAQLVASKKGALSKVKEVMQRQALGDDKDAMGFVFDIWVHELNIAKRGGRTELELEESMKKVFQYRKEQADKARTVLLTMASSNDETLIDMVFQAWLSDWEEAKLAKRFDTENQQAVEDLKCALARSKSEEMKAMYRALAASDEAFLGAIFGSWWQSIRDEKRELLVNQRLEAHQEQFKAMNVRQTGNIFGMQGKAIMSMEDNILLLALNNWYLVTKLETMESKFNKKLDQKRRQLQGVQNLFRTFAAQLESGIGDDSSRNTTARGAGGGPAAEAVKRPPRQQRVDSKGMLRGADGAVSLPDIHQR